MPKWLEALGEKEEEPSKEEVHIRPRKSFVLHFHLTRFYIVALLTQRCASLVSLLSSVSFTFLSSLLHSPSLCSKR
jgi:hypothetical protein